MTTGLENAINPLLITTQAILLTEDHHLIEFPSLLLPTGVSAGSIVNISVCRNKTEEERKMQQFWDLENNILEKYGQATPQAPFIRVKNLTQTSLILEWDPLVLHLATLRSLEIFKNGSRVAQVKKKKGGREVSSLKRLTHRQFQNSKRLTILTFINCQAWM
jgi:hypothetical protein